MRGFWMLAASALIAAVSTAFVDILAGAKSTAGGLALIQVACVAGLTGLYFKELTAKISHLEAELRSLRVQKNPTETSIMERKPV